MIIYYSGGDAGVTHHPEVMLPKRGLPANIMLAYANMTGKRGDGRKYVPRFKQIRRCRRAQQTTGRA